MAHKKNNTNLTELLLQCMTQPDPMLSMLEWLCTRLMEAEVDQQLGAEKSQRTDGRSGYRSGYRPRRLVIPFIIFHNLFLMCTSITQVLLLYPR